VHSHLSRTLLSRRARFSCLYPLPHDCLPREYYWVCLLWRAVQPKRRLFDSNVGRRDVQGILQIGCDQRFIRGDQLAIERPFAIPYIESRGTFRGVNANANFSAATQRTQNESLAILAGHVADQFEGPNTASRRRGVGNEDYDGRTQLCELVVFSPELDGMFVCRIDLP
jgi:hypothetical protein